MKKGKEGSRKQEKRKIEKYATKKQNKSKGNTMTGKNTKPKKRKCIPGSAVCLTTMPRKITQVKRSYTAACFKSPIRDS